MFEENNNISQENQNSTTVYEQNGSYGHTESTGEYHAQERRTETYSGPEPVREEAPKQPKKPSAFGRFMVKTAKLVVSAAVFGLVAGGVFYGVNYFADKQLGTNVVTPADSLVEIATTSSIGKAEQTSTSGLNGMDVSNIVENTMPAMVSVSGTVTTSYGFNPFFGGGTTESPTAGSGVIIGKSEKELLVVTNAHVVDGVNNLQVAFCDGTTASATVKGTKSNRDIAVIAVSLSEISDETISNIAIIEIGNSDELVVGNPIIAIGNALGEGQSVTVGWVSALNNTITIDATKYEGLIRISAAINPGNSGGALLNTQGQLIGINSAKYAADSVEGIGYAIPISSVADIINDLMNREIRDKVDEAKMGYIGISGIDITSDINQVYGWPIGLAISTVAEDSAAQKAGLVKNDIIVGFDGVDIATMDELRELLTYYSAGETVKIDYYRLIDGEYILNSTELTLGVRE